MRDAVYDRDAVVQYARRWAFSRNPRYYNFDAIGGDCTNFASQCLLAGATVMNYTPTLGWYYRSSEDRSPSWTGVEYLYRFLVNNRSVGPYGHIVSLTEVEVGDVIQLGRADGMFYHSPVVTAVSPSILVAAHTFDALDRPLNSYVFDTVRCIHIDGVRIW